MKTKTKLVWLELIGGIVGWIWILASIASIYFLATAIFFDSPWLRFFWVFGTSVVAKWLAAGFRDNQLRIAFVAGLMEKGLSREQAEKQWFDRYVGKKT